MGYPNRYRLTVGWLRTLGAASPEELREKLRPGAGALAAADAPAEAVPLEDHLAVLALIAGLEEAHVHLVGRALRAPARECGTLLQQLVSTGVLSVFRVRAGRRYRRGPAATEVLGEVSAAVVSRAAERAGVDAPASSVGGWAQHQHGPGAVAAAFARFRD